MESIPLFISGTVRKDRLPNKQIKRQLSWEGHPTHQPAKSLRHNEKEKSSAKYFFLFHPSGLIPFPFGSALPFPFICFLFFLFFSFGNIFLRILRLYAIFRGIGYFVVLYRLAVTSFSWRICGARKRSKKNTAFSLGFLISNDRACPYGSGSSTFLPF